MSPFALENLSADRCLRKHRPMHAIPVLKSLWYNVLTVFDSSYAKVGAGRQILPSTLVTQLIPCSLAGPVIDDLSNMVWAWAVETLHDRDRPEYLPSLRLIMTVSFQNRKTMNS
jgi:hypothetical protein